MLGAIAPPKARIPFKLCKMDVHAAEPVLLAMNPYASPRKNVESMKLHLFPSEKTDKGTKLGLVICHHAGI